jgi:hypothetical protein
VGTLVRKTANWFVCLVGERSRILPLWMWGLLLAGLLAGLWLYIPVRTGSFVEIEDAFQKKDLARVRLLLSQGGINRTPRGVTVQARLMLAEREPALAEAGRLLRAALADEPELGSDQAVVDALIRTLEAPGEVETLRMMAKLPGERVKAALLNAVRHPSYRLRWRAIDALRRLGESGAVDMVEVFMLDLATSRTCAVRRRAAFQLGQLGDVRALPALRQAQERGWYENLCMGNTLVDAIRRISATAHGMDQSGSISSPQPHTGSD